MKWLREHAAEVMIAALALVVGAGVFIYAHKDEGELNESKRRGAAIVSALEQHHAQQDTYPETLEALIPRYVRAIEPPTWGLQRWRYRRYTGEGSDTATVYFQLSVAADESGHPVLYYDVTSGRWVLNN